MSATQLSEAHLKARRSRGLWMIIGGAILLILGLYISAFLIPDVIQSASGPQSLSLTEAAKVAGSAATYARIEDGAWDCDTLRQVRGLSVTSLRYGRLREETRYSEVFFEDDNREVVVFVTLSGDVNCDDLAEQAPTGYLYAMQDDTRQSLTNDARLARYFSADSLLEFCGYCGQENSLIGAAFGLVFVVMGGSLLIAGVRTRKPV